MFWLKNNKSVTGLALGLLFAGCSTSNVSPTFLQAQAEVEISSTVMSKLNGLSEEQRAFLRSSDPLRVIASREMLMEEIERRDAGQLSEYVSDMMAAVAAFAFQPDTDLSAIPLNAKATGFNSFTVLKPQILNERSRSPGPFSVSRYIHQVGGIPTFAGAKVAITPEDLIAGKVDVAIAGIPQSMSSGNRDARNGPKVLRGMHGMADRNVFSMVDPGAVLNIVDYGDFSVDRMSIARSVNHIHDMVFSLASTGAVPFLVGGDHSVMYPTVKAVRDVNPDIPLTVVHFGAHYNAEKTGAHALSDRDAVYLLLTEGVISGNNLIQVGLRGPQATLESFQWLRERGVMYHTMAEVELRGWDVVMERVLDEAKSSRNPVYVSFDVSVMDPGELSAAGRATPGGLTVRELAPLVRRLCAETPIAGFEIMDMAPMLDLSYVSAMNANYMLNACLTGMAMRKQGLSQDHYLNPITVDHGQY
jgi:guanidinobutyrase